MATSATWGPSAIFEALRTDQQQLESSSSFLLCFAPLNWWIVVTLVRGHHSVWPCAPLKEKILKNFVFFSSSPRYDDNTKRRATSFPLCCTRTPSHSQNNKQECLLLYSPFFGASFVSATAAAAAALVVAVGASSFLVVLASQHLRLPFWIVA